MTVERDIELLQRQITMLVEDVQATRERASNHRGHTEVMKHDIARLETQMMGILKPEPKEPETKYTLQHLRDNWLAAERRADSEEAASLESGGILSDVCDIAFEDEMRAADHGYDGIRERVKALVEKARPDAPDSGTTSIFVMGGVITRATTKYPASLSDAFSEALEKAALDPADFSIRDARGTPCDDGFFANDFPNHTVFFLEPKHGAKT